MAGTAQHCVDRIAQRTLEPIAIELAVGLHVADGRLDRAATPNHCSQPARNTAAQAWVIDLHTIAGDSLVAAVDDSNLRLNVAENRRLFQRFGQRVPIVRIEVVAQIRTVG